MREPSVQQEGVAVGGAGTATQAVARADSSTAAMAAMSASVARPLATVKAGCPPG